MGGHKGQGRPHDVLHVPCDLRTTSRHLRTISRHFRRTCLQRHSRRGSRAGAPPGRDLPRPGRRRGGSQRTRWPGSIQRGGRKRADSRAARHLHLGGSQPPSQLRASHPAENHGQARASPTPNPNPSPSPNPNPNPNPYPSPNLTPTQPLTLTLIRSSSRRRAPNSALTVTTRRAAATTVRRAVATPTAPAARRPNARAPRRARWAPRAAAGASRSPSSTELRRARDLPPPRSASSAEMARRLLLARRRAL